MELELELCIDLMGSLDRILYYANARRRGKFSLVILRYMGGSQLHILPVSLLRSGSSIMRENLPGGCSKNTTFEIQIGKMEALGRSYSM